MQLVEKMNLKHQAEIDAFIAMQNNRDDVIGYAKSGCAFNVDCGEGQVATVHLLKSDCGDLWLEVYLHGRGMRISSRVSDYSTVLYPDALNELFKRVNDWARSSKECWF